MNTIPETTGVPRIVAVRTYDREDRRRKFYVQWRLSDGSKPTESFLTAASRDAKASALKREMSEGEMQDILTREETREYRSMKAMIGETPWLDVVFGWRNYRQMTGQIVSTLEVGTACDQYLAAEEARHKAGQIADGTFAQKKCKVRAFKTAFAGRLMAKISADDIRAWLDSLGHESAITYNDYLKHVVTLFAAYPKDVPQNPAGEIPFKQVIQEEVGILTVTDTAKLFEWARINGPIVVPRLAIEAFAGLRFSSSFRLDKADINFADRGILLPARKIKTRRRFYIDGLPENLWPWLDVPGSKGCWELTPAQYMHLKSKAFIGANVPHPHNCLRHSFASYHVAAYKNPGLTAALLCHTNQQKLWSNYNGVATNADGLAYFSILPGAE